MHGIFEDASQFELENLSGCIKDSWSQTNRLSAFARI